MSNWAVRSAEEWVEPIADKMKEMLISGLIVHCDESKIQVLHEDNRKATTLSEMWVYCAYSERSIILFDYRPHKSGRKRK